MGDDTWVDGDGGAYIDRPDTAGELRSSHLQIERDRVLFRRLAVECFVGHEYESLAQELIEYAMPILRNWCEPPPHIFRRARELGSLAAYSPQMWDTFVKHRDEWEGLLSETVAVALKRFRKHALEGRGWSHERGATLKTYFVNNCALTFPGVLQKWNSGQSDWRQVFTSDDGTLDRVIVDPSENVVDRLALEQWFADVDDSVLREILHRVFVREETHAEVAKAMGLTSKQVEGRIYRYRKRSRQGRGARRPGHE